MKAITTPASDDNCLNAIEALELLTGHKLSSDRKMAITLALTGSGWTKAEVIMACKELAFSTELDDKLRYQGTITPADFLRVRRDAQGIKHVQMMDYHEMRKTWNRQGGGMHLPMSVMFATVETERGKRWRLRTPEERAEMMAKRQVGGEPRRDRLPRQGDGPSQPQEIGAAIETMMEDAEWTEITEDQEDK